MTAIFLCFLLLLALQLATPFWWWIMLVPFLFGLARGRSGGESLKVGAVSAGMLWLGAGLYKWVTASRQISDRMIRVLGAEASGAWLLFGIALLAALAAGISGYSGYACKAAWAKRGAMQ